MSKQEDKHKQEPKKPDDWSVPTLDAEARQNLVDFFALLLKIDQRINPKLYRKDANN